jgi:hypothetical protein
VFGGSGSGGRGGLFGGPGLGSGGLGGGRGLFGGRRRFRYGGNGTGPGAIGCFTAILLAVIVAVVIVGVIFIMDIAENRPVTWSSYQREPLPAGTVNETSYIRDDAKWLVREDTVKNSMRNFFRATGVQPYLWITETIRGSRDASWEEIEAAMNALYQEQFTDEGHLILLFYEPSKGVYKTAYVAGSAAKTVIDDEASQIILDCFDKYYYSNLEEDEYFATVFEKSADMIMRASFGVKQVFLVIGGLIALFILYKITAMILRHRRLKRQQDIDILNADVSKIGDDEAERLAEKYDDE